MFLRQIFADAYSIGAGNGQKTTIIGGDKVPRTKITLEGPYKGKESHFEWIIEPDNTVNHRLFVPKE